MIKRLWQFPAVIGGTALLTFCGVNALQANINRPLRAYGATVEAARASASASAAAVALAAAVPSARATDDAGSSPQSVQAAAMTTPTALACAGSACAPAGGSERQGAAAPPVNANGPSGDQPGTNAAPGRQDAGQAGVDDSQGAEQSSTGWSPAPAQAAGPARGTDTPPGQAAAAAGNAARGVAQQGSGVLGGVGALANSGVGATTDAAGKLARDLNQWLGLDNSFVTVPFGVGIKATGAGASHGAGGNHGGQGQNSHSGR